MDDVQRTQRCHDKEVFITCIVPVHNEQEVVVNFVKALYEYLQTLTKYSEIIIVNDASTDGTLNELATLKGSVPYKLLSFSRNFGKENALTAGLEHASGDVTVLIDADFQHPIALIGDFLHYWSEGYDMVYGVRNNRNNESHLKRNFSRLFYKLMGNLTDIHIPPHAGDFRLLDRSVVKSLNEMNERGRFMKGLYAWVGYNTKAISFEVQDRAAGQSSWRFRKLTELALTGITSFSDVPLRIWGVIGSLISFIAFIYASYIVIRTLVFGADMPGFATIVVAIMFFGGIQLLSIGILGEYIARIFNEVKQRPRYIIAKKEGFE